MSTLSVTIDSPQPGSRLGARTFTVNGSVALETTGGRIRTGKIAVSVRFGINGPVVAATFTDGSHWVCTGTPLAGIHPDTDITIFADASATLKYYIPADRAWDIEDIEGSTSATFRMPAAIPPTLTIAPQASPVVTDDLPVALTLTGTAVGQDAPIAVVQYSVEGWADAPLSVVNVADNYARWSVTLPAPPGDHTLSVKAYDRFGTAAGAELHFTVQPRTPIVVPPGGRKTLAGGPTTSSVTSWTRLEPSCTDADMGLSASARVFDPLWMLTRQWQLGEFQAEDGGMPAQARVRAASAALSRCFVGELPRPSGSDKVAPAASAYDPSRTPLEVLVERRGMRPRHAGDLRMLNLAVEAGLHFLRLLEGQALTKSYRAAFLARLALKKPEGELDGATGRYLDSMRGRAPDGRLLAELLRTAGASQLVQEAPLGIAAADQPKVQQAATAWLAWYDSVASEPAGALGDGWNPARLEYALSVGAQLSADVQDDMTYSASELDGGPLDWSSFDIDPRVTLGTHAAPAVSTLVSTAIPAPVSFPGAPAPRFWEMEDAKIAYGLVPVGPTDLIHMMTIEYVSSYGNDWFMVPLALQVGSVTRVDSLVVTDTFGVRTLLRPIGDPALAAPHFSMWQSTLATANAGAAGQAVRNRFLLAPTLARTSSGAALEEVIFMRDEMANLAWAIERSIESPIEQPLLRDEAEAAPPAAAISDAPGALPRYQLATTVPANWIPLMPVEEPSPSAAGQVISRLQKGAVLQADGSRKIHAAMGEVLEGASPLRLYDEEVPREGVRITRQRRLARWSDGSTWLWTALRHQVGQGEGTSGLRFDQVMEPAAVQGPGAN